MKNFIITTDTTCDLPAEYIRAHGIGMLSLTYTLNEATYSWENPLPVRDFYDHMRNGSLPTTSQANPEEAKALSSDHSANRTPIFSTSHFLPG